MVRRFVPAAIAASAALAVAASAEGGEWHSAEHHVTCTIPDGWVEMAAEDLASFREGESEWKVVAGFVGPSGDSEDVEPTLIISVIPWSATGLDRTPTQSELAGEIRDALASALAESMRSGQASTLYRQPRKDYLTDMEFGFEDGTRGHTYCLDKPTKDGIVEFDITTSASAWQKHATVARDITESVRVDPGSECSPSPESARGSSGRSPYRSIGAIVGAVVAIGIAIVRRMSR